MPLLNYGFGLLEHSPVLEQGLRIGNCEAGMPDMVYAAVLQNELRNNKEGSEIVSIC